jgi:hypothetical protein
MTQQPAAPAPPSDGPVRAAPQSGDGLARRANAARLALYLAPSPYRLRVARRRERELVAGQTAEGRAAPYVRGVVVRWREGGGR